MPINPQAPLDISVQPRVLSAPFGPGYPYTLPDGINTTLRSVSLKYEPITQAEFLAIDAFFTANLYNSFFYQLPDDVTARLWVVMSRTRRVQPTVWGYEVSLAEQPISAAPGGPGAGGYGPLSSGLNLQLSLDFGSITATPGQYEDFGSVGDVATIFIDLGMIP